jgi:hypothetical protein
LEPSAWLPLIELTGTGAAIKRRLRLELAAEEGGDSVAAEIGITTLRSARSARQTRLQGWLLGAVSRGFVGGRHQTSRATP